MQLAFFVHNTTHDSCIKLIILVCGWCQATSSKSKYQILVSRVLSRYSIFIIKILFLLKYSYSCIGTAFSNIFENAGNSDIGLQLSSLCGSSFLNNGIIFAIFNLSGKIPVESDWFKIKVIGDNMRWQIFFISIVDISSWPQLCFELIYL